MNVPTRTATRYTVRSFEPADRGPFLSMYESVFGHDRGPEWFRWKFTENPYVDHVPILVATADGEPVGFRSFFAQEMRVGGLLRTAFQPCDTMVHPDHRRRGLFGRLNERALERYADDGPSFFFNFPNENSKPGNLAHGWREIGTVPAYYRPQNPLTALEKGVDAGPTAGGESDAHPAGDGPVTAVRETLRNTVSTSNRVADRLLVGSDADIDVERYRPPPADVLAAVYRRSIPDAIHAHRTAAFFRRRFDNPAHTYAAYVARRNGEPIAALVVSTVDDHARIVDALPRAIATEAEALDRLLASALDDHADRRYVEAFGETVPAPLRFRFYPDTRFPLSALLQPTARTLLARDLEDGLALESSSISSWSLSRLDLDTT
ncbi:GNAT family N-acetyltransferase [Natrinema salinisoli]|uniref:GNAT family N-acetyltransferase n=1 Tax=Natrinema salinisoli TaxID=2878535 RepID=UPI001CEFBB2C|nr:GNAT family N-acetyltransferase [Natrinema salinisoli]